MILPIRVMNGMFAARCALLGDPDQGLLGIIDSGANATAVDVQTRRRASLKVAGESTVVHCIHRNHNGVLGPFHGHMDICGKAEYATVFELDMGPEYEKAGINAILGWDVLGRLRITMDGQDGTGTMERRAAD